MDNLSPEIKAQLEEQKKQCLFCKIIAGEIPSKKVFEDEHLIGILDINPATKGHILLMPKEHYPILPYLPHEEFSHLFGRLPKIAGAVKKAMASTGMNVIVSNGGAAGQQSPHSLIHLFPREDNDSITSLSFDSPGKVDRDKEKEFIQVMQKNLPLMIQRQMGDTEKGKDFTTAGFLASKKIGASVFHEDGEVLVMAAANPMNLGHTVIDSQKEETAFELLSPESSVHLFKVASLCATALFEGLKSQGTNIILKSGRCNDNQDGSLEIHVLPREREDGLALQPSPMDPATDLESIEGQLKEELVLVEQGQGIGKTKETIVLDPEDAEEKQGPASPQIPKTPEEEIEDAINDIAKERGQPEP